MTCHDPHKRAAVSVKTKCETCHSKQAADFKGSRREKSGVECTDCHMPPATKSAESFGKYIGDIKTHIVKIDTRANASMFTADGKFASGIMTVDSACLRCHGSRDKAWAVANARGVHARGKEGDRESPGRHRASGGIPPEALDLEGEIRKHERAAPRRSRLRS